MDFQIFVQRISKVKNLPLLGERSHIKMAPAFRVAELRALQSQRHTAKKAGVMALFFEGDGNTPYLLLILRKTYQGVHSNQIAFPGGKMEPEDADLLETALRETHEEVGVAAAQVHVVRALSEVYIPPSNFEVSPFLGVCHRPVEFVLQESEVETLVTVPLNEFMDDASLFQAQLDTSYAKKTMVPAFRLNGYTVWGATAMMLSELKDLLKQVL